MNDIILNNSYKQKFAKDTITNSSNNIKKTNEIHSKNDKGTLQITSSFGYKPIIKIYKPKENDIGLKSFITSRTRTIQVNKSNKTTDAIIKPKSPQKDEDNKSVKKETSLITNKIIKINKTTSKPKEPLHIQKNTNSLNTKRRIKTEEPSKHKENTTKNEPSNSTETENTNLKKEEINNDVKVEETKVETTIQNEINSPENNPPKSEEIEIKSNQLNTETIKNEAQKETKILNENKIEPETFTKTSVINAKKGTNIDSLSYIPLFCGMCRQYGCICSYGSNNNYQPIFDTSKVETTSTSNALDSFQPIIDITLDHLSQNSTLNIQTPTNSTCNINNRINDVTHTNTSVNNREMTQNSLNYSSQANYTKYLDANSSSFFEAENLPSPFLSYKNSLFSTSTPIQQMSSQLSQMRQIPHFLSQKLAFNQFQQQQQQFDSSNNFSNYQYQYQFNPYLQTFDPYSNHPYNNQQFDNENNLDLYFPNNQKKQSNNFNNDNFNNSNNNKSLRFKYSNYQRNKQLRHNNSYNSSHFHKDTIESRMNYQPKVINDIKNKFADYESPPSLNNIKRYNHPDYSNPWFGNSNRNFSQINNSGYNKNSFKPNYNRNYSTFHTKKNYQRLYPLPMSGNEEYLNQKNLCRLGVLCKYNKENKCKYFHPENYQINNDNSLI
jgi:hypothetical protein